MRQFSKQEKLSHLLLVRHIRDGDAPSLSPLLAVCGVDEEGAVHLGDHTGGDGVVQGHPRGGECGRRRRHRGGAHTPVSTQHTHTHVHNGFGKGVEKNGRTERGLDKLGKLALFLSDGRLVSGRVVGMFAVK